MQHVALLGGELADLLRLEPEHAAERGHVLHQLRDVTVSLEEAYFRLTGESVEYRAPNPAAVAA